MGSYFMFILYVITVIYAFMYHGAVIGFLNILIPYQLFWDLAMFIGTH